MNYPFELDRSWKMYSFYQMYIVRRHIRKKIVLATHNMRIELCIHLVSNEAEKKSPTNDNQSMKREKNRKTMNWK